MIKAKGFSDYNVRILGNEINKWLEENPNFTSYIQYRISSMEAEMDFNHCALVIYKDGEDYIVSN